MSSSRVKILSSKVFSFDMSVVFFMWITLLALPFFSFCTDYKEDVAYQVVYVAFDRSSH